MKKSFKSILDPDSISTSNQQTKYNNGRMLKTSSINKNTHQPSKISEHNQSFPNTTKPMQKGEELQNEIKTEQSLERQIKEYENKIRLEKEQRATLVEYKQKEIETLKASIYQMNQTNQKLQTELEKLQVEVQEKLDRIEFKDKKPQFEKKRKQIEDPLEQLVKVKEKELKCTMGIIGSFKKEREKYEELIKEKVDLEQINLLNDQIKIANEKIIELEKEISFLQKIKEDHMACIKKKEKLEFDIAEIKRSILIVKKEKKEKMRSERAANVYKPTSQNQTKHKKSPEEREREIKRDINNFWVKNEHVFSPKTTDKQNSSLSKVLVFDKKSKRNVDSQTVLPKIHLFNSEEKKVLLNILPSKEIEKFERRYESIDITKVNLEKKFAMESKLLNKENQSLETRFEYSTLQLKENEEKNKELLKQIDEQKRELQDLKGKLGDLMKNLEDSKTTVKEKEDENKKLKAELQSIQTKISSMANKYIDQGNQVNL